MNVYPGTTTTHDPHTGPTLRAHWAVYRADGLPAGPAASGSRVLACSAGPHRRRHFERLITPTVITPTVITSTLAGPGPADTTGTWLTFTTTGEDGGHRFLALTLHGTDDGDPDDADRDGADRDGGDAAGALTRYYTTTYAEAAPHTPTYSALWRTFRDVRPPHDRERPVRVPLHTAGDPTAADRITTHGFDWAATVAATLLDGPVVITGAAHLGTAARLDLLDSVTALLPYGCRGTLDLATWLPPGTSFPADLAFGPGPAAGTDGTDGTARVIALGSTPAPPGGPAGDYLAELRAIERRSGLPTLVAALAAARTPRPARAGDHLLDLLAEADPLARTAMLVRRGTASADDLAAVLRTTAGPLAGAPADDPHLDHVHTAAVTRLLDGDDDLEHLLAARWREDDGDTLTRLVATTVCDPPPARRSPGRGSPGRAARRDRLIRAWRLAAAAGRGDRLVRVLLGTDPRLRPERVIAELCLLLGPEETTAVPALYDTLWNSPAVVRRLLFAASATGDAHLRAWLEVIRPWDERAPGWLAPYALLAGEPRRPAEAPPTDAVFVLHLATRTGRAGGVLTDLWGMLTHVVHDPGHPAAHRLAGLLADPLGPDAPPAARVHADLLRLDLGLPPVDAPLSTPDTPTAYPDALLALRHDPAHGDRFAGRVQDLLRTLPLDPGDPGPVLTLLRGLIAADDPATTTAVAAAVAARPALTGPPTAAAPLDRDWWAKIAQARPDLGRRAAGGWFRTALTGTDAATAARLWATAILDAAPTTDEEASAHRAAHLHEAGRWWNAATPAERRLLLPALERALIAQAPTPRHARAELRAIRLLIAAHRWGPDAAAEVVAEDEAEYTALRRHVKAARAALRGGDAVRAILVPVLVAVTALLGGTLAPLGGRAAAAPVSAAAPTGTKAPAAPAPPGTRPATDPAGAERLVRELKADQTGTDLVLIVDTSAATAQAGRYDEVKAALTEFTATRSPRDRIGVIGLGPTATVLRPLSPVGDPAEAAAVLPPPDGSADGLGQALTLALDTLRGTAPDAVTGVVLLTGAQAGGGGDPAYASPVAKGWSDLRAGYTRLRDDGRELTGYGVPLTAIGGASTVVRTVFEDAHLLEDVDRPVATRLTEAGTALRMRSAGRLVDAEKGRGVTATWLAAPEDGPAAGEGATPRGGECAAYRPVAPGTRLDLSEGREMCLRLTATTTNVPLQVTGLRVDGVKAVGLDTGAVTLDPGVPHDLPVNLAADTHRTDGMWKDAGHYDGTVHVVGEVRTPLADPLREQLPDHPLEIRTQVLSADLAYRGDERVAVSWWPWTLAALGAAALAGALWAGSRWGRPALRRRRANADTAGAVAERPGPPRSGR